MFLYVFGNKPYKLQTAIHIKGNITQYNKNEKTTQRMHLNLQHNEHNTQKQLYLRKKT